jgi:3-methyl-2-oxobutanoate hydroxymethyltransferase
MTKRTVPYIHKLKSKKEKIIALTAYDYTMAKIIDSTNVVDLILVGDSLGSIVKGEENTLSVTLNEIIYHTKSVCKGVKNALVVSDMPFMSYQVSIEKALISAGKILKSTNANAVKLEGGVKIKNTIKALVDIDIPVLGHVGLTPQSYNRMGGHKIQGKEQVFSNNKVGSENQIIEDAKAVEEAGAFAIVLEGIPESIASKISNLLSIPTISIACGENSCDGKILVTNDLLGFNADELPPFVKPLANFKSEIGIAVKKFAS